jgi:hypothetical protein
MQIRQRRLHHQQIQMMVATIGYSSAELSVSEVSAYVEQTKRKNESNSQLCSTE